MLLENGFLNDEQLKQAVIGHKKNKIKLGQFLVREGFVSSSTLIAVKGLGGPYAC